MNQNILLVGPPRSGTTWAAKILSVNKDVEYIHEPDNEKINYAGFLRKQHLSRFPYLREDDKNDAYYHLFNNAVLGKCIKSGSRINLILFKLSGVDKYKIETNIKHNFINNYPQIIVGEELINNLENFLFYFKKKHRIRLVKSVHSIFSIPFLIKKLSINPILFFRHPASCISSYIKLKMPDANRSLVNDEKLRKDFLENYMGKINDMNTIYEKMGVQIGIMHLIMRSFIEKYKLKFIYYEDIISDPIPRFEELYNGLHLEWNDRVEKRIMLSNKEGKGYETNRISNEMKDVWKKRLSSLQIDEIQRGYSILSPGIYKDFE